MFDYGEWHKKVKALKQQPMDDGTSKMFMQLTMAELAKPALPVIPQLEASFPYKVCVSRAEYLGFTEITWPAAALIAHLSSGNPGNIVMYLSYLRNNYSCLNMNAITGAFPMGFPSAKDWETMWDAQKDEKGKNGLDSLSAQNF